MVCGGAGRKPRNTYTAKMKAVQPAAVMKVLGEYANDSFEAVQDWPVAFINEYVIRRRVLGKEKALAALDDLKKRVDKLMGNAAEDVEESDEAE